MEGDGDFEIMNPNSSFDSKYSVLTYPDNTAELDETSFASPVTTGSPDNFWMSGDSLIPQEARVKGKRNINVLFISG